MRKELTQARCVRLSVIVTPASVRSSERLRLNQEKLSLARENSRVRRGQRQGLFTRLVAPRFPMSFQRQEATAPLHFARMQNKRLR